MTKQKFARKLPNITELIKTPKNKNITCRKWNENVTEEYKTASSDYRWPSGYNTYFRDHSNL